MARVRAQPVDEELSEVPSFSNPDFLLISSTMFFPTELCPIIPVSSSCCVWNYGTNTFRKVGKDTVYFLPST